MKVCFIALPDDYNFEPMRNQPLVALYILTILEERYKEKVELSICDLRINDLNNIPESDLYLYSIYTPDFYNAVNTVKFLKDKHPNSKHVAGGVHVMAFPDDCEKVFDSIIVGEGEYTIIELLEDYPNIKKRYIQKKIADINKFPFPLRKFLPKESVLTEGILFFDTNQLKGTNVMFSRGCPYNCYFCASRQISLGPPRYRSPKNIYDEIMYLKNNYNVEALALKDENCIPNNRKIAIDFLKPIKDSNIPWRGQTRADNKNYDLLKIAEKSKCHSLGLGIESVSKTVLKIINKKLDLDLAKNFIKQINKTNIKLREHFMIGLPNEPDDIVKQTKKFIIETKPDSVLLSLFCPLPASYIFDNPEKFNIVIESYDWNRYLTTFGRFKNEKPIINYRYKKGLGKTKETIINEYLELQQWLKDGGYNA